MFQPAHQKSRASSSFMCDTTRQKLDYRSVPVIPILLEQSLLWQLIQEIYYVISFAGESHPGWNVIGSWFRLIALRGLKRFLRACFGVDWIWRYAELTRDLHEKIRRKCRALFQEIDLFWNETSVVMYKNMLYSIYSSPYELCIGCNVFVFDVFEEDRF